MPHPDPSCVLLPLLLLLFFLPLPPLLSSLPSLPSSPVSILLCSSLHFPQFIQFDSINYKDSHQQSSPNNHHPVYFREGWFSWYSLTAYVSCCCQGSGPQPRFPIFTVPNQVSLINLTCFLRNSSLRHTGFGCVEGTEVNAGNLQSLGHNEVKIRGTCTSWERARTLNIQGWEELEDAGIQTGES